MFCNTCGSLNPDDASFCNKCGSAVSKTPGTPEATPSQPVPTALVQQPTASQAVPPAAKKAPSCFLMGCLGIVGLVVVLIILGALSSLINPTAQNSRSSSDSRPPATEQPTEKPTEAPVAFLGISSTARINQKGDNYPCFPNRDDLDAFVKAAAAHDDTGGAQALLKADFLKAGDHVRAIDAAGFLSSLLQLRLEDGDNSGDACWVPSDAGIFKDVQS